MVLEKECQPEMVERFYLVVEQRVENIYHIRFVWTTLKVVLILVNDLCVDGVICL